MITFDFNGKIFVVAGAGGMGAEIAKTLSRFGARVILMDVSEPTMAKVLPSLPSGKAYSCDFSDLTTIEPLVKEIVAENGPIDGLVYTAGIGDVRPIKLCKPDFMLRVMNINFFSFVELIRCFTIKNRYNPKGMNIVGISALGAYLGNSAKTAYCASKGAMNAAVRCLAKELASKNIRVNTVAPGVTETPMAKEAEEYSMDSEEHKQILLRQYLGVCQPSDIADTVVFLMSDMSRMITGSCIAGDGGKLTS